jgi:dephospho-CoA kinase
MVSGAGRGYVSDSSGQRNVTQEPRTTREDGPLFVVGLTGNIASGKSLVAARLTRHGIPVVDADLLARDVVRPGTPALAAITAHFGDSVLAADGTLDRAALRQRVFSDPEARKALEAITHPAIGAARSAAVAALAARGASVVVCDIPLLYEAGLTTAVDAVILVDAPVAVRRERLIRDRGLSAADADAMIAAQWPADRKRATATWIIENHGSRAELEAKVDALLSELRASE